MVGKGTDPRSLGEGVVVAALTALGLAITVTGLAGGWAASPVEPQSSTHRARRTRRRGGLTTVERTRAQYGFGFPSQKSF